MTSHHDDTIRRRHVAWLLSAARLAAEDEKYPECLALIGDAAQAVGELVVANAPAPKKAAH